MSTVLAYHAVGECDDDPVNLFVSPRVFERQMAWLARWARVVPLAAVAEGRAPLRAVAITFDDGYRSVLELAVPILRRHGFPATTFVPTKWVGGRNEWDPPTSCDRSIMDAAELREAERAGLTIESHGHAHVDLGRASPEEARDDVRESVRRLEETIGRRPRFLAYPYGSTSPLAKAAAAEAGLEAAFTLEQPAAGPFARSRVNVAPLDGSALFALKASGAYLPLRHGRLGARAYAAAKPLLFRGRWS